MGFHTALSAGELDQAFQSGYNGEEFTGDKTSVGSFLDRLGLTKGDQPSAIFTGAKLGNPYALHLLGAMAHREVEDHLTEQDTDRYRELQGNYDVTTFKVEDVVGPKTVEDL